jgi:hypothetical protein
VSISKAMPTKIRSASHTLKDATEQSPQLTGHDIVLISIDALRAITSAPMAMDDPTPKIDALANAGVALERAYCAMLTRRTLLASLMTASHASADAPRSGRIPHVRRVDASVRIEPQRLPTRGLLWIPTSSAGQNPRASIEYRKVEHALADSA